MSTKQHKAVLAGKREQHGAASQSEREERLGRRECDRVRRQNETNAWPTKIPRTVPVSEEATSDVSISIHVVVNTHMQYLLVSQIQSPQMYLSNYCSAT